MKFIASSFSKLNFPVFVVIFSEFVMNSKRQHDITPSTDRRPKKTTRNQELIHESAALTNRASNCCISDVVSFFNASFCF